MSSTNKTPNYNKADMVYSDSYSISYTDNRLDFLGVVHDLPESQDLIYKIMEKVDPDIILYEEHLYNRFDPDEVQEHEVILEYAENNNDVTYRSMDIPEHSDRVDCIGEVVEDIADNIPKVPIDALSDEEGMIRYNAMFESNYPELYSFMIDLRNEVMARVIYNHIENNPDDNILCVVGQCHLFGNDSLQNKLTSIGTSE